MDGERLNRIEDNISTINQNISKMAETLSDLKAIDERVKGLEEDVRGLRSSHTDTIRSLHRVQEEMAERRHLVDSVEELKKIIVEDHERTLENEQTLKWIRGFVAMVIGGIITWFCRTFFPTGP